MEEFTQSVKATLYERAKKPFTGTFFLAWIAYNWKILVAIFFINEEHLNGITRIKYIENLQLLGINNLVVKPFGIAIVALIALGILNIIASWIVLQFKNFQFKHIDKRQKVDGEGFSNLLVKLRGINNEFSEKINSINKDRAKLIKDNRILSEDYTIIEKELEELKQKFSDVQEDRKKLRSDISSSQTAFSNAVHMLKECQLLGFQKKDRTLNNLARNPRETLQNQEAIEFINDMYKKF